ncbi:transposase domain-containing protein, partial [Burkholderia ubonensis]|uniref:transposase domain-containing protein n=1 Tax=Burkholderia ubonensis TaxID=101571 RepID=UPI001160D2D5
RAAAASNVEIAGAQASANLYSLVETCKANGVEPYRYLFWLFTRLPLAATAVSVQY